MGCDVHVYAEKVCGAGETQSAGIFPPIFDVRNYALFGFLAGVRNYSAVAPISAPRGLPANLAEGTAEDNAIWGVDGHNHSWLSVDELLAFDYEQTIEDRRVTRRTSFGTDGGCTASPGGGQKMPLREFLGAQYFADLQRLKESGATRIVFWFDN